MKTLATFSHELLHMGHASFGRPEQTYIHFMRTLGTVSRNYQWPIGMDVERESKDSILSARFDDDEVDEPLTHFF